MELSPWEATSLSATQEISQRLTEPEVSSAYSQEPSTGPYSGPDQSSPYNPILLLWGLRFP
jgi:hypothetical protein